MPKNTNESPGPRKLPVPPQAFEILVMLAKAKQPLSAPYIAKKLGILPNAAYRSLKTLLYFGLIRAAHISPEIKQPTFYSCVTLAQARRRYLKRMDLEFEIWFKDIVHASYANRLYRDIDSAEDAAR